MEMVKSSFLIWLLFYSSISTVLARNEREDNQSWISSGAFTVGAVCAVAAIPVALPVLGFTAGVAAGSFAAATQSAIYGGATTGAFSALQSAGAVGVSTMAKVAIGTGGGMVANKILSGKNDEH